MRMLALDRPGEALLLQLDPIDHIQARPDRAVSRPGRSVASLFAGPALGILLSGSMTKDGEPIPFEGFKSKDWGIVFGLDWAIKSRIVIDLRYTKGLGKFIEMDGEPLAIKNTAITLMVGYIF